MEELNTTYQTGSTRPPKSHQGIIAFLLILVILLCGTVTALSYMNIKLFRMLEKQENDAIAFSQETIPMAACTLQEENGYPGFSYREIDDVYRSYQQWPQGLYITEVTPGSPAEKAQLRTGDILTKVNGTPVDNQDTLNHLLKNAAPGTGFTLTVSRDGKELTLNLTASN